MVGILLTKNCHRRMGLCPWAGNHTYGGNAIGWQSDLASQQAVPRQCFKISV